MKAMTRLVALVIAVVGVLASAGAQDIVIEPLLGAEFQASDGHPSTGFGRGAAFTSRCG